MPADAIKELLLAAVQAPSVLNQQPWAFAVFQGRARLSALERRLRKYLLEDYPAGSELPPKSEFLGERDRPLFHGANVLIVIYATFGRAQPTEDCCLAAQNLMLAAHAMGLATCPIGYARYWFDMAETKRELEISPTFTAVFPLVLGYASETPEKPPRKEPQLLAWEVGK